MAFAAVPATPHSTVELSISCLKLKNLDVLSKSDPCCVISLKNAATNQWNEIGRTETIKDNLNPEFSRKIQMTYFFEERQLLKFDLYDIDNEKSSSLAEQEFIGSMEGALGEIVSYSSAPNGFTRTLQAHGGKQAGTIKVVAEELGSCKEVYNLKFSAGNLETSMFGGAKSYFLEFYKTMEGGKPLLAHRTQPQSGGKTCSWPMFQVSAQTLCGGDVDRTIQIALMKYKSNGSHKKKGSAETNIRTLLLGPGNAGNTYKLSGSQSNIWLESISKDTQTSFLDYIRVG